MIICEEKAYKELGQIFWYHQKMFPNESFTYRKEAENGYDYSYARIVERLNDNDYKKHEYTRLPFDYPIKREFLFLS